MKLPPSEPFGALEAAVLAALDARGLLSSAELQAPCYDMLPMAYRPDAHRDDLGLTPLPDALPTLPDAAVWPQACVLARTFWRRVAAHPPCSAPFRAVAAENARRIAGP